MALGNTDQVLSVSGMSILALIAEPYHMPVSYMEDFCFYGSILKITLYISSQ